MRQIFTVQVAESSQKRKKKLGLFWTLSGGGHCVKANTIQQFLCEAPNLAELSSFVRS